MALRSLLRRASTVVPALVWLAHCLPIALVAQSSHAARSDSAAVASVLGRFLTAFENLEWEPFHTAFADSATVFHPAANMSERVTGRAAIDSTFRAVFADVRAHATGSPPFQRGKSFISTPRTSRRLRGGEWLDNARARYECSHRLSMEAARCPPARLPSSCPARSTC